MNQFSDILQLILHVSLLVLVVGFLVHGFPAIHIGKKEVITHNHYYDDGDDDYEDEEILPPSTPFKAKISDLYN